MQRVSLSVTNSKSVTNTKSRAPARDRPREPGQRVRAPLAVVGQAELSTIRHRPGYPGLRMSGSAGMAEPKTHGQTRGHPTRYASVCLWDNPSALRFYAGHRRIAGRTRRQYRA